ncbi:hypothetical protein AVEN_49535-1 [Araneus ventricosus]|uniref:Uncharacterized protein n=1 Tax=Araneus ventricosus TaxID=182803 RepID=A0A4Y2I435_ARAVE|nr:hypothetical protein AVEN_49535-1 [Araneus ventricosus]
MVKSQSERVEKGLATEETKRSCSSSNPSPNPVRHNRKTINMSLSSVPSAGIDSFLGKASSLLTLRVEIFGAGVSPSSLLR